MGRLYGDEGNLTRSGAVSKRRFLTRSLTACALPACLALATGSLAAAPDDQENQTPAVPAEASTAIDDKTNSAATDDGDALAQNDRRERRGPRGDFGPPARRDRSDRGPRDFSSRDSGRRGPPRWADRSRGERDRRPAPEFAHRRGPRHFGPPGGRDGDRFDHRGGPPRGFGHYHHARYEGPRGGWGPHGPPHRGQSSEEVIELLHDLRNEVAQLRREIHQLRASSGRPAEFHRGGSSSSSSSGTSGGSSSGSSSSGSSSGSSSRGDSRPGMFPRGMGRPGGGRGEGPGIGPRGFRGPPEGGRSPAEMREPRREDSGREGPGREGPRDEPRRPEGRPQRAPGADGPPRTGFNDTPAVRDENPAQPVVTELVTPAESIPAQEN